MGARGPRPKTAKPTIKFAQGVPPAPAWLDAAAKVEYRRVAAILGEVPDHLQQVDFAVLCQYAQSLADVARLTKLVRKEGEVLANRERGTKYINPTLSALSAARNALMESAKRLGFSPTDRVRASSGPAGKANPLSGFIAS